MPLVLESRVHSESLRLSYNTNRLLRVLAIRAAFEKWSLGHLEGLLRSTWCFLDEPLIWQVEGNNGSWMDCCENMQEALRHERAGSQTSVSLRSTNWCYQVDLNSMTQTNLSTG